MVWTLEDSIRSEKRRYDEYKPVREQVITTYEAEKQEPLWVAHLTSDEHFYSYGTTEQQAIGQLWLNYPHKIIEECRRLPDAHIA
jgi:hypothetical protein